MKRFDKDGKEIVAWGSERCHEIIHGPPVKTTGRVTRKGYRAGLGYWGTGLVTRECKCGATFTNSVFGPATPPKESAMTEQTKEKNL
jgi:hypothetical protein